MNKIYIGTVTSSNELVHYGRKGMRWGQHIFGKKNQTIHEKALQKSVSDKQDFIKKELGRSVTKKSLSKHFKPPTSDVTFTKGSEVTHITPLDFKSIKKGQDLYVSADQYDKNLYKTFLSLKLKNKGFANTPIKEVRFTLKKNLKAPSNDTQKRIYSKMSGDPDFKSFKNYNAFIKSLDTKSNAKTKFINELSKQGYNAVLDTHDITDTWMQAKTPLIVINAMDTLGGIKVSNIRNEDINRSLDYILKENHHE